MTAPRDSDIHLSTVDGHGGPGASTPAAPRLVLSPTRRRTVLDGGWWPRSWDLGAELPGLVLALAERHGRIRHIMLNLHGWDSRIHRMTVGPDVVHLGWFDTLNPAVLVATTGQDVQVDLLVVPPDTAPAAAERAMATAADPANLSRAPGILAALDAPSASAAASPGGKRPEHRFVRVAADTRLPSMRVSPDLGVSGRAPDDDGPSGRADPRG
ncbi:DUF5994 family protein [Micromonospora sp. CPCC 205539]|uniref:DUF5994 family protein n=1 Tax=Micromonospora sp. CPCC 205539 TaxID=3122408 RepID=UPI002FF181FF